MRRIRLASYRYWTFFTALTLAGCATGVFVLKAATPEGKAQSRKQDEPQLVGRQRDGSVLNSTNQLLTPAGRQVEFAGRPLAVALSADRRTAAFLDGAATTAIVLVDVETWTLKQEFTAAGGSASFNGLVYSPDGTRLYASQASGQIIVADVAADGRISLNHLITTLPKSPIPYPGREDGDPYPGGLAVSADGTRLYVVLNRNNSLAVVDLGSDEVLAEIPVGQAPHAVVVVEDRAYVTNQGGRTPRATDFTNDSSGSPIVAGRRSGNAVSGTVSVVDLQAQRQILAIPVGVQPTALALDGSMLFVANTNSDSVSMIDLGQNRVVRTIAVDPFPGALLGSSPNALAVHDGHLVVSLGRANALGVFRLGVHRHSGAALRGLIPTGWYPSALAVDPVAGRLIVANGKGVGSLGARATVGPDPATNKRGNWVHSNQGSASLIAPEDFRSLGQFTRQVFTNNGWDEASVDGSYMKSSDGLSQRVGGQRRAAAVPLPERLGEPSVFKHVFYIIKENRTYDQILGGLGKGNGDPSLVQFGRDVTPNQHALAEQFTLFDNLYDSGSNSADGHQWVTQAFAPDYVEKSFGGFTRTYPFNGGDALAYARSGFLWDNAVRHGKSVRVYGEYVNGLRADGREMGPWNNGFLGHGVTDGGTWRDFYQDVALLAQGRHRDIHTRLEAHSDIPSLQALINPKYPPYHQIIPDQYRVEVFLREFKQYVRNRDLPELVIMALTNDHTEGTSAGYPTPRAMVADNDLAVGRVVEAISHSPYWKDSVIVVIEDDAQNGVDHVDGHRTLGSVISPYTKRGHVESHYYTQIDLVRAIEQILGLPPMNQMDMAVEPTGLRHAFTRQPDLTPFTALANQIPLDELNPAPAALSGLQREWAVASARMDFSRPDAADEDLLNRATWYATRGFDVPYPGDGRVLRPDQVKSHVASLRYRGRLIDGDRSASSTR